MRYLFLRITDLEFLFTRAQWNCPRFHLVANIQAMDFSLSVKVAVRAISTSFHAIRQESTLLLRITNLEFLFIRAQGTHRDVDCLG